MISYSDNFLSNNAYKALADEVKTIKKEACSSVPENSRFFLICDHRRKIMSHIKDYPAFSHYLKKIIKPEYNIIIHNILYLKANKHGIKRHINSTLKDNLSIAGLGDIGNSYSSPDYQTVYYVNVPSDLDDQGKLTIYEDDTSTTLTPVDNRLIEFSGGLPHEVSSITTTGTRITLFTEQYKISPIDLIKMQDAFVDKGTMYGIKESASDGEFQMPYD